MLLVKIVLLPILIPLAVIYAMISFVRNIFFDLGIFRSHQSPRPVVSVGNVTAGGTGKTPVCAAFIEHFVAQGVALGLVSRGYGGLASKATEVKLSAEAAKNFGDEPTWFKTKFPSLNVFVGPDRVQDVGELLVQAPQVRLIFADDALQHRRLKRDLDVIVLDAAAPLNDYLPIPLGRGREDFIFAIRRAGVVVLNNVNLARPVRLKFLKKIVSLFLRRSAMTFEFEANLGQAVEMKSGQKVSLETLKNQKLMLVCGIARPRNFLRMIEMNIGAPVHHIFLKDHVDYNETLLSGLETKARALGVDAILTTEKDAVKIAHLPTQFPIYKAELKLKPLTSLEPLYERISRFTR